MLDIPIEALALIVLVLALVFVGAVKALSGGGYQVGHPPPAPSDHMSIEEEVELAREALPAADAFVQTFGGWPTEVDFQYAQNLAPDLTDSEKVGAKEIFRLVRDGHLRVPPLITRKVIDARGSMRPAHFMGELRAFISLHTGE